MDAEAGEKATWRFPVASRTARYAISGTEAACGTTATTSIIISANSTKVSGQVRVSHPAHGPDLPSRYNPGFCTA
eukprot:3086336-Rhodomonas_salina.1